MTNASSTDGFDFRETVNAKFFISFISLLSLFALHRATFVVWQTAFVYPGCFSCQLSSRFQFSAAKLQFAFASN